MLRLWVLVLIVLGCGPLTRAYAAAPWTIKAQAHHDQSQQASTQAEAAAIARKRYGGQVLKISKAGKFYKVRLLTEEGRVKEVKVPAKQ